MNASAQHPRREHTEGQVGNHTTEMQYFETKSLFLPMRFIPSFEIGVLSLEHIGPS
jgi:hypothetical protein